MITLVVTLSLLLYSIPNNQNQNYHYYYFIITIIEVITNDLSINSLNIDSIDSSHSFINVSYCNHLINSFNSNHIINFQYFNNSQVINVTTITAFTITFSSFLSLLITHLLNPTNYNSYILIPLSILPLNSYYYGHANFNWLVINHYYYILRLRIQY
jgi:hypothetical protein